MPPIHPSILQTIVSPQSTDLPNEARREVFNHEKPFVYRACSSPDAYSEPSTPPADVSSFVFDGRAHPYQTSKLPDKTGPFDIISEFAFASVSRLSLSVSYAA